MQDIKDHSHKDFIDHSWKNMEALLDERLPVQETAPRNNALVWVLGLLLLLMSATAVYLAHTLRSMPALSENVKERIVIKEIIKEVFVPSATTQVSNNSTAASFALPSEERKTNPETQSNPVVRFYAASSEVIQKESISDITIPQELLDELETIESTQSPVSLAYERPESELDLYLDDSEVDYNQEGPRRIKLNMGFSASSSRDAKLTGLGVFSGVDLPISRRLELTTGLALSYLDREHMFMDVWSRETSDESFSTLATYYVQKLQKVKQVSVPISLNYFLTKSLAINSGVNLRYNYVEEVAGDFNLIGMTEDRYDPIDRKSFFNNANFGLSAGLKYNFSPHFSILVDSEWGMSSLINRNIFRDQQQLPSGGSASPALASQLNYNLHLINLRTYFSF